MFLLAALAWAGGFSSAPAAAPDPALEWRVEYDEAGLPKRAVAPGGKITAFTREFDAPAAGEAPRLKRLTRKNGDGSVVEEFDRSGRRVSMRDGAGLVKYRYDDLGRLAAVEREGAATLSYEYDTLGRVKRYLLGGKSATEYEYDFLGRTAVMKTPAGEIKYDYQLGQGKVIRTLPNGVWTSWSYEPNGRLKEITHVASDDKVIAKYTYEYRADNLIAKIVEWTRKGTLTRTYEYDKVQRLVSAATSDGKTWRFEYDEMGNRTSASGAGETAKACKFDWAGRLTELNGAACEHDAAGNLSRVSIGDSKKQYEFDAENRLKRVSQGEVGYEYDGDGYLVARAAGGVRTTFVPDPTTDIWRPLLAAGGDGKARFYLWDGKKPLAVMEDGNATFFLEDHLGSVRCVLEQSGRVAEWKDYAPFGEASSTNADSKSVAPGFAGMFWDGFGAVAITGSRAFSPALGRFLQTDPQHRVPAGSQKDLAIYAYCGGDPVNFIDRNGAAGSPAELLMDLRDRQSETRLRQSEMSMELRARQSEMRQRQIEMLERLRRQSEGVGIRQLEGARKFRDDTLQVLPSVVEVKAIDLVKFFLIPVNGLVGSIAGGVASGLEEYPMRRIKSIDPLLADNLGRSTEAIDQVKIVVDAARDGWDITKAVSQISFGKVRVGRKGDVIPYPGSDVESTGQHTFLRTEDKYTRRLEGESELMRFAADHFRDELAGKVVHAVVAGGIEAPSPVGGVYLGGAGKSLEGLGQLSGVAVDPVTGSVVLLAKDGEFQLPPLRMDDLVTIFRSVYLHGEPPSVTINPRKDNPHGELMDVVHGSATKDSYAGWILFEADRIMKCYTIGQDNETKENVSTSVAGYPEVLQTIFFGGGFGDGNKSGGNWERFWIVPSGVSQFRGTNRTLTLFDVPLKVKTQKMVMKEGRLQDDPHGESSAGAKAFIEWFTRNYEAIAQERSLPPPAGSGLAQPVQVFTELRRVALICAIAEQLRDQGVAMPEWMRDHEVAKVPVTPTTPALTVPKSAPARNGTIHASIYGGVNLAPADDVRKSFDAGSQLADLTPAQRETTKAQVATADALTPVVLRAARENPPLQTFAVQAGDQSYHAVSLPGADSKALMPCRLSEADLVVPVEGGGRIALAREFNSFFRPTDVWGAAWTMAQPRLEKTKVPVKRTDHAVTSKEVPELHVPLEGAAVRFSEIREVPSIHATLAVPDHTCGILGLATAKEPLVAAGELDEVVFKDGHSWYFDRQGQLVGERSAPFTTVYARDSLGTLRKITGYLGTQASATISLEYNLEGRLKSATARSKSGEETVTYGYGPAGLLESVTSSQGQARYAYENGLVKQIAWSARQKGETFAAPKILRQFDYTAQGQLKSETDAQGATVSYRIESQAGELRLAVAPADKARGATTATYDAALRPLELKSADHTQTTWRYLEDGTETATTKYPDGESQTTTMTADGKRRLTERSDQIKTEETFDQARRLTALAVNGKPMFAQQWHPDGLLRSVDFETHSAHHEYDGHGVLVSIMQTPPGAEGRLSKWQRTEFDRDGRPVGVKDFTGEDSKIGYDEGGRIRQIVSKQNGKDYGLTVQRSGDGGRVESIQSSWGDWKYRYAADGSMESARFSQGRDESALEFGGGRLKQVTQFDGGKTAVEYYAGAQEGLVKAVRTPAIALDYQYGAENRLERIGCGKGCSLEYEYDGKGRLCAYRMRPRDLAKETSAAAQTAPQTTSQTAPPTAPQATSPQRSKLMKWLTGEGTKKP